MVSSNDTGKIRLKDIADATGFSINTVSHALKDKPDISRATKKLIQTKAREMGYIADAVAGSLRSGVSRTLAVILGDMANPHFGLWVRSIERAAFKQGYSTLMFNTDEDEQVEAEAIRTAVGKRVDGIILCPAQKTKTNLDLLKQTGVPFVLLGRRFYDEAVSYVIPDDKKAGLLATSHLLDQDCDRILFLNGPTWISSARERYEGFCQAHHLRGKTFSPGDVRHIGIKSGESRVILEQVLEEGFAFDGLLAFSDLVALEARSVLLQRNTPVRIPIVGFDDILSELSLPVSLVSVASIESVAERSLDALMMLIREQRVHREPMPVIQKIIDVALVEHL
jgi:LacI family transcriptional regulator